MFLTAGWLAAAVVFDACVAALVSDIARVGNNGTICEEVETGDNMGAGATVEVGEAVIAKAVGWA